MKKITLLMVLGWLFAITGLAQQKDNRPNIIYIFTEQQHANMMSSAGNPWLKTPAMYYIAENGIRFTRAYTTNPVCVPARVSMMTGPAAFRDNNCDIVRSNSLAGKIPSVSEEVKNTTIAAWMKKTGYDLVYEGKNYRDDWPVLLLLKEMYQNGELNEVQSHFVSDERPAEEFYDLQEDPHETNNLVHSIKREHAMELAKHRDILYRWIIETDDKGRFPESDEALKAVIDRWGNEAVNKEYDRVRDKKQTGK